MSNTWNPSDSCLASFYAQHSTSLRGALRHALVTRALLEHLAGGPLRILDIGGGTGVQAITLAGHGHHVTVLDPDQTMLARARAAWEQRITSRGSIDFLHGPGEQARDLAGGGWDAVLCHGVLMYLDDPQPVLRQIAQCVRPSGVVSILAKNAESMAMRPALERRWAEAREALASSEETGRLGVTSRGVRRDAVEDALAACGVTATAWYGVRIFTDHLKDTPVGEDFPEILQTEWQAGCLSPYRDIARLFHLISRRAPDEHTQRLLFKAVTP
ncbi:MAG: methyltransferase domain-containing protein [Streptomycetaceae bacterium]|nr:methyltransferase domain-containing protein [Streptomycetaceae bacterium]